MALRLQRRLDQLPRHRAVGLVGLHQPFELGHLLLDDRVERRARRLLLGPVEALDQLDSRGDVFADASALLDEAAAQQAVDLDRLLAFDALAPGPRPVRADDALL